MSGIRTLTEQTLANQRAVRRAIRWSQRRTLAEEHHWRAQAAGQPAPSLQHPSLGGRPARRPARGHVHAFARMACELGGHRLPAWTDAVRADELPALHAFADGLRRDHQAVTAGLTLPWSSGPVEGHDNRIKMLKPLARAVHADLPGDLAGPGEVLALENESGEATALQAGRVHELVGEHAQAVVVRGRFRQSAGLVPRRAAGETQTQGQAAGA